jgi:hypothetical protein
MREVVAITLQRIESGGENGRMSGQCQKRLFDLLPMASDLPLLTDILRARRHVSNEPISDICIAAKSPLFDHLIRAQLATAEW